MRFEFPMETVQDYRKTVTELKRAVSKLGTLIDSLILYGSAARGKYKGIDSDIDVLVIAEDETNSTYEKIRKVATKIDLNNSTSTNLVYFSCKELLRNMKLGSPFLTEAIKEGIPLYDNGTFKKLRAGLVKVSR